MPRHKDLNWNLPDGVPGHNVTTHQWESLHAALLMDIRDELKALNALLHCSNFVGIPTTLRAIQRQLPAKKSKA